MNPGQQSKSKAPPWFCRSERTPVPTNNAAPEIAAVRYHDRMRVSLPMVGVVFAAFTAAQQPPLQAPKSSTDSVAWGSAVSGLRLGIAFGSDPSKLTLQVFLQNVATVAQDLTIGNENGKGPSYDYMKFIATAPDGKQQVGLHRSVYVPIAGLVLPLSVRLNAGETHGLEIPLNDIIFASRTTVTLDALVKQGHSVRVRFEVTQQAAEWAKLSHSWIGTLSSAEISPAH